MGLSCVIVVISRPLFSVVHRCSLSNLRVFSCAANVFSYEQAMADLAR